MDRPDMIAIRSRHLQKSILDIPYYMHKHNLVWGEPVKTERRIKLIIKIVAIVLPSLLLVGIGWISSIMQKRNLLLKNEEE
jgi:hypothetical protein